MKKSKRKLENTLRPMKKTKSKGIVEVLRGKFIAKVLAQETWNISKEQCNPSSKKSGKKEKTKPKVSESKEIVKITGKINKIETKISLENIHENKT